MAQPLLIESLENVCPGCTVAQELSLRWAQTVDTDMSEMQAEMVQADLVIAGGQLNEAAAEIGCRDIEKDRQREVSEVPAPATPEYMKYLARQCPAFAGFSTKRQA